MNRSMYRCRDEEMGRWRERRDRRTNMILKGGDDDQESDVGRKTRNCGEDNQDWAVWGRLAVLLPCCLGLGPVTANQGGIPLLFSPLRLSSPCPFPCIYSKSHPRILDDGI